jgi:hypothetical protein
VANAREEAAVSAVPACIAARYSGLTEHYSAAPAGIAALDPGLTEPDGPVYIAYLSL